MKQACLKTKIIIKDDDEEEDPEQEEIEYNFDSEGVLMARLSVAFRKKIYKETQRMQNFSLL